jgi:DNA repair ATPase RecN
MMDIEMSPGNVRSIPKELSTVIDRIPRKALEIERRYQRDENFQSICHDYAEACEALQRWQSKAGQDDRRTLDYRRLLEELESELLSILQTAEALP